MATQDNAQSAMGTWKMQTMLSGPFHSRNKKYKTHFIITLRVFFFRFKRKIYNQVRKKLWRVVFGNHTRKCGLSDSWDMSFLPQHASPLESNGEINHWDIGFWSQLGRTGQIPSQGNGPGEAALWIGVRTLQKALLACAVRSSWLD